MHDPKYESVIPTGLCEGRNLSTTSASGLSRWFLLQWNRHSCLPRPWRGRCSSVLYAGCPTCRRSMSGLRLRHFASETEGAPSLAPFAKGRFLRCSVQSLSSCACSLPLFHSSTSPLPLHLVLHSPFATPHSPMTLSAINAFIDRL